MAKLKKKDTQKTLAASSPAPADVAEPLQTEEALPVHLQLKFIVQKKAQNPNAALDELKAFRPRKILATAPIKMFGHPNVAPLAHFIFTYGNGGWSEGVEYIVSLHTKYRTLTQPNANGEQIIHILAQSPLYYERIQQLLDVGIDINTPDINGKTPLHHAVAAGNAPVVRFLLEKGALYNAVDSAGELPMHSAARSGNKEIIGLLLDRDPNAYQTQNTKLQTPVHLSLHYAKGEVMEYLSTAEQRTRFFAKQWAQYDAAKAKKKNERTPEQSELVENFNAAIIDGFKKHHQKIQWKLGVDSEGHTIIHSAILNSSLSKQQFEVLYEERKAAFRVTPKGRDLAREYADFARLIGNKAIAKHIEDSIIPRRDHSKAMELEEKKAREKAAKKAAKAEAVELEASDLAAPLASGTATRKTRANTVVEPDVMTEIPVHRKRSGTLAEAPSPSSSKDSVNKSPSGSDESKKSNAFVRGIRKVSSNLFGTPPKPAQGDKVPLLKEGDIARAQSGTNLNLRFTPNKVSDKASRHKTDKPLTPRAAPSAPNTNRSPKRRSSTEELSFQEILAESASTSSSDEEKSQGRG